MINLIFLISLAHLAACQWPTFQFYSRQNKNNYILVTPQNLLSSGFSHSKDTKFLVHGFGDSGDKTSMLKVKDEFLVKYDFNVIVVNWDKGAAAPDYFKAAANVKIAGQKTGEFILQSNINPTRAHCIGHSLGSHVCGFTGKVTKLKRISGLDPAGPLFKGKPASDRLDKTDAEFVDNIHTDWLYGIQDPIGHKDFYPNGGSSQTGCSILDGILGAKFENLTELDAWYTIPIRLDPKLNPINLVACSHLRVPFYYAESINSNCNFKSIPCSNYNDYKNGICKCSSTGCTYMGYWANLRNEVGRFYLETNKVEPYCKSL